MADNASDVAADWATTQQINLARFEGAQKQAVLQHLQELESEIVGLLNSEKTSIAKQQKLKEIQKAGQQAIAKTYATIGAQQETQMVGLAKATAKDQANQINSMIGASVMDPVLTDNQLKAVAKKGLVFGAASGDWWKGQDEGLQDKFGKQMAMGYSLGESVDELSRRVRGTKANGFKDGVMQASRREAEALVRSSVQTISNTARLESMAAQQPLIKGIQWLATLDSRTTDICKGLSGLRWTLPDFKPVKHQKKFPGPVAHWNCRSTQIPVTATWDELAGKKIKTIGDDDLQAAVEKKLKAAGKSDLQIAQVKVRAKASMDGQVAKELDYEQWLKGKDPEFIRKVLGPGRQALWESGQLTLADLTDQDNRPLTLEQLETAIAAGEIPVETEGASFATIKPVPFSSVTAEDQAKAQAEMAAAIANPKGKTLLVKAIKKLDAAEPDLAPVEMLAKAQGMAAEMQAAASKASKLSTAKKKILAGKKPSPSEQATIDGLTADELANWKSAIEDAEKVKANDQEAEAANADAIEKIGAMLFTDNGTEAVKQAKQTLGVDAEPVKLLAEAQEVVTAIKINELLDDAQGKQAWEAAKKKLGTKVSDQDLLSEAQSLKPAIDAEFQIAKQATDQLDAMIKQGGDAALAVEQAESTLQGQVNAVDLLDEAQAALQNIGESKAFVELEKIQNGEAEVQKGLKQKALKKALGDDTLEDLGPGEFGELLTKVEGEAAEKQAAASKASKLSTAKKKILQGKQPSPSEQATIDDLSPGEKEAWLETVTDAKAAAKSTTEGMKIAPDPVKHNQKKGLAALKKLEGIEGTDYEDFLDYVDDLSGHKVNPLQKIDYDDNWEVGEIFTTTTDSFMEKFPNQLTKIDPKDLITAQVYVESEFVEGYIKSGSLESVNPANKGKPPLVVKVNGQLQIHDGNHRAAAALLSGSDVEVLLYDLDQAAFEKNPELDKIYKGPAQKEQLAAGAQKHEAELAEAVPAKAAILPTDQAADELTQLLVNGTPGQIKILEEEIGISVADFDDGITEGAAKETLLQFAEMMGDDPEDGFQLGELLVANQSALAAAKKKDDAAYKKDQAKKVKAFKEASITPTGPATELFVPDVAALKKIKDLDGSTKPWLAEDPATGKQYVVKSTAKGLTKAHLKSEATTDALYRAAGANVPASAIADGGKVKVAEFIDEGQTYAKWLKGKTAKQKAEMKLKLQQDFVADALFANWDVAGASNDNILITKDGTPVRIDNGGGLGFRAQGGKKTEFYSATGEITELKSLRDPSKAPMVSQFTQGISSQEIERQMRELIDRKDKILEAAKPLPKADRDALARRFEWMEAQLPAAPKRTIEQAATLQGFDQIPKDIKKQGRKVKVNGLAIPVGTADVEDTQALVWQEKTKAGDPVTVVQLKVSDDGAQAVRDKMAPLFATAKTAAGQTTDDGSHPSDQFLDPLVAAAKTLHTHKTDKNYTEGTLQNLTNQGATLAQLKAKAIKDKDKGLEDMVDHYQKLWDGLMDVDKQASAATIGTSIPLVQQFDYDPKKYEKKKKKVEPRADRKVEKVTTIKARQNVFKDGEAQNVSGSAMTIKVGAGYRITTNDGVEIQYVDRQASRAGRSGLALEGTTIVRIPAEMDAPTMQRALQELSDLGIDIEPPSDDYKDWLWIHRTAALRKEADKAAYKKTVMAETDLKKRSAAARKWAKSQWGVLPPAKGSSKWKELVDGEANHDGSGYRKYKRADVDEKKRNQYDHLVLQHSTGASLADAVEGMLNSGGEATTTTGRIQKGVSVNAGMSSATDVTTGGASYFFTRVRKLKADGKPPGRNNIFFKGELLNRADAISYTGDRYGRISDVNTRKFELKDYESMSGSDETIFKNGIDLVRDVAFITTMSTEQRNQIIASYKSRGWAVLPDGRKIEEVILPPK